MSHDQAQSDTTAESPASEPRYADFPPRRAPGLPNAIASPPPHCNPSTCDEDHRSNRRHQAGAAAAAPAVAAAMSIRDPEGPTLLQKWAARASESQFNALSGAVGGFTSGIVTCPLDVIKTKLQAQGGFVPVSKGRHVGHHKVYEGLIGTARVIWKDDGIRGMYRGLGPIILGYLPTWAVWFTVYTKSKEVIAEHQVQNQFLINFGSSIVAGASSTVVTNPIWVIKTRLMSQSSSGYNRHMSVFPRAGNTPTSRPTISSPWHYHSTLDAARKMYSSEGVLSFYSGLTPALLGLTHVAVQFPAYEFLRKKFTGQSMGQMGDEAPESQWLGVLSASILSKILASSATYPHEVIRTRLQTQRRPTPGVEYLQAMGITPQPGDAGGKTTNASGNGIPQPKYRGVVMTFRTILREEGWRAFYAGMGVNMMRAVPAATVTMMTYEYVMKTLHHEKSEALRVRASNRQPDTLLEPPGP